MNKEKREPKQNRKERRKRIGRMNRRTKAKTRTRGMNSHDSEEKSERVRDEEALVTMMRAGKKKG